MSFVIRVDADARIGSGHFMRMIALAQVLRDHGREVHVATACGNDLCDAYLADERLPVHAMPLGRADDDARALVALSARLRPAWIVLDGARFDEVYQRTLRDAGHRVMSVDDFAIGHFASDVVLNQNYGAEDFTYSTEPYTTRLLGIRHVLLRREFRAVAQPARIARTGSLNVLVTHGGTRQPGLLARTLEAVLTGGGSDVSVKLVAGAFQSLEPDLEELCRRAGARVSVVRHNRRMAEAMQWADAAIAAAGSTMWELLYMRVPFLALPLDAAQEPFVDRMVRGGLCGRVALLRDLSAREFSESTRAFLNDPNLRARILARSAHLIDPQRAWRELSAVLDA